VSARDIFYVVALGSDNPMHLSPTRIEGGRTLCGRILPHRGWLWSRARFRTRRLCKQCAKRP
jgi:hypothetical protein